MLPIKKRYSALFASLALGAACVFLAFYCYKNTLGSELFAQLVFSESDGGRLALKFTNVGQRDLVLNTSSMSYTLVPSLNSASSYLVYVFDGGLAGHPSSGTVLAAGASLDIGNILPVVRTLPAGEVFLSILYQSFAYESMGNQYWHGTIRSFPTKMELTGE